MCVIHTSTCTMYIYHVYTCIIVYTCMYVHVHLNVSPYIQCTMCVTVHLHLYKYMYTYMYIVVQQKSPIQKERERQTQPHALYMYIYATHTHTHARTHAQDMTVDEKRSTDRETWLKWLSRYSHRLCREVQPGRDAEKVHSTVYIIHHLQVQYALCTCTCVHVCTLCEKTV